MLDTFFKNGHNYMSRGERWGLIMLGFILGQLFMVFLFNILKSSV